MEGSMQQLVSSVTVILAVPGTRVAPHPHAALMAIRDDAPMATASDLVGLRSRINDAPFRLWGVFIEESLERHLRAFAATVRGAQATSDIVPKPVFRVPMGVVRPL
jgi:hypothetical protein